MCVPGRVFILCMRTKCNEASVTAPIDEHLWHRQPQLQFSLPNTHFQIVFTHVHMLVTITQAEPVR